MASHVLLVFTNPIEGQDDEFNDWYDNIHLSDSLEIAGVTSGQRFEVETPHESCPGKYLTIYEFDGDVPALLSEMDDRVTSGEFKVSPALDGTGTVMWNFRARGERHLAE